MSHALKFMALAAVITAGSAADAHHSYAMFDLARIATVQGKVKVVEWTNPHVWVWVDDEAARSFAFETVSPGELMRFHGWNRSSLGIGQTITVEYAPLRSGRNGGAVRRITFADGKVLETQLARLPAGGPPPGSPNAKH
jgi:hypothetical protein